MSVEIINKDDDQERINKINDYYIEELQRLLKKVDNKRVGGHNKSSCQFIISFEVEKNHCVVKFLGDIYTTYPFNKDALYLNKIFNNTYPGNPVRVPELGKWIQEIIKLKEKSD